MPGGRRQRSDVRCQRTDVGGQRTEDRDRRTEIGEQRTEDRDRRTEVRGQRSGDRKHGIRPPASPSCRLSELEAVGATGAYAPDGMRKFRISNYRFRIAEWICKGQREYAERLGSLDGESQNRPKAESSTEGLRPLEVRSGEAER